MSVLECPKPTVDQGPRLLFFAAPYAEADGQPYRAVERRITVAER